MAKPAMPRPRVTDLGQFINNISLTMRFVQRNLMRKHDRVGNTFRELLSHHSRENGLFFFIKYTVMFLIGQNARYLIVLTDNDGFKTSNKGFLF